MVHPSSEMEEELRVAHDLTYRRAKLKQEAKTNTTLKTNIALKAMIDSIQGISSSPAPLIQSTNDESKVDIIKSFHDDMDKLLKNTQNS